MLASVLKQRTRADTKMALGKYSQAVGKQTHTIVRPVSIMQIAISDSLFYDQAADT